ncbi:MAG: hypothetical protein ABI426_04255 [Flavobacterium sp.]
MINKDILIMIDDLIKSGHIKKIENLYIRQNKYENSIILTHNEFENGLLKNNVISSIKKLNIKEIELNDLFGFNMFDLNFVDQINWVEGIKIIKSDGVNSNDLKRLENIRKFVNNYSSEPVDFLSFKKLEKADILWSKGRENILECENLESLTIHKLKLKDLKDFKKLKNLKNLSLINSSLESLEGIEDLENLESLEICINKNLNNLTSLSKLNNLKWLKLEKCSKLEDITPIKDCIDISFISILDCKKIINNEVIFKLIHLNVLAINNSGEIKSIHGIEEMKNLERFIIYNSNVIDGDLKPLIRLKNLKWCKFSDKKHYNLKYEEVEKHINMNQSN